MKVQRLITHVIWHRAPRLHREPQETVRRTTWLELFFDLVYVVIISLLARNLAHDLTPVGFGAFLLLIVPCIWTWVGFTLYNDRFDVDFALSRAVTFVQIAAASNLALHVMHGADAAGFALAFVIMRAILIAQYVHAGVTNPAARALCFRYAAGTAIAASMWLVSIAVPAPVRLGLWLGAIAIDLSTPLTFPTLRSRAPINMAHVLERFGLFTIIVLGEAVEGVIRGRSGLPENASVVIGGLCGLLMAFNFWWIYFDNLTGETLRDARITAPIWLYGHIPLTIGLVSTSVGIERLLALMPSVGVPLPERLATGLGLAVCLTMLGAMHRLVRCPDFAFKARVRFAGAAIALAVTPLAGAWRPLAWVAFLALVMLGQVAGEARRRTHPVPPLETPSPAGTTEVSARRAHEQDHRDVPTRRGR